jgi:hypothetical protein
MKQVDQVDRDHTLIETSCGRLCPKEKVCRIFEQSEIRNDARRNGRLRSRAAASICHIAAAAIKRGHVRSLHGGCAASAGVAATLLQKQESLKSDGPIVCGSWLYITPPDCGRRSRGRLPDRLNYHGTCRRRPHGPARLGSPYNTWCGRTLATILVEAPQLHRPFPVRPRGALGGCSL